MVVSSSSTSVPELTLKAVISVVSAQDGNIDLNDFSSYRETVHARSTHSPPSVQSAVRRILYLDSSDGVGSTSRSGDVIGDVALEAVKGVLGCYKCVVRDAVFAFDGEEGRGLEESGSEGFDRDLGMANLAPGGRSAIIRYEMLLYRIFVAVAIEGEDSPTPKCGNRPISDAVGFENGSGSMHLANDDEIFGRDPGVSLCSAIIAISIDVVSLTSSQALLSGEGEATTEVGSAGYRRLELQNIILPCLLRVLTIAVRFLGVYISRLQARIEGEAINRLKRKSTFDQVCQSLFANLTLVATAFTSGDEGESVSGGPASRFDLATIFPQLCEDLCLSRSISSCSYPPVSGSAWDSLLTEDRISLGEASDFLQKPAVDVDSISIPAPWLDSESGIGRKTAMVLLNAVVEVAGKTYCATAGEYSAGKQSLLRRAVHFIGREAMAKISRAHFFGRTSSQVFGVDPRGTESIAIEKPNKSTGAISIRKPWFSPPPSARERDTKSLATTPHVKVPSRVHSCLRVLFCLRFPDVTCSVLDDFLPVCFTLIDSHVTTHQALGAVALRHLMKECTPTVFAPHKELAGNVLELGCRICREAAPLAVLSNVRAAIFDNIESVGSPDTSLPLAAPRRKATSDLLALIRMQRGDDKMLLSGVLIGGVNPLLAQHADLPNADAMELLRPGLTTLIPLVTWDSTGVQSRTVQLAALAGLVSLLMGAHPLVPRHGGKIMANVLSCLGRAERDLAIMSKVSDRAGFHGGAQSEEYLAAKALSALALHVASVVLVLCGDRSEAVLVAVENGRYEQTLVRWCEKIREEERALRSKEEKE